MAHMLATPRPSSDNRSSQSRPGSSTRKQPSYEAASLIANPSPLLTSSLHSRNSATSTEESAYLAQAAWLRWIRLILTVLTIAIGLSAVACAGHVLKSYNVTHLGVEYHLYLWPINVDLRPNLAILTTAAIATFSSLVYLLFSLIPTPHSRTFLFNIVFAISSVIGVVLCIFAIPFNLTLTNPSTKHPRESLQSWTCKFSHNAARFNSDAKSLGIPVYVTDGIPIPAGFKRLCSESEVSIGLMAALLVLGVVGCAIAGVGVMLEKKMGQARRVRYADNEKRVTMT